MIIGARLKERIDAARTSQAALAGAIGVTPQAISKMVNGSTTDTGKLYQIARFLQTTPEYLTGESDSPQIGLAKDDRLGFRGFPSEVNANIVEVASIDLNFGLGAAFMDQEVVEYQVEKMQFPGDWLRSITSSPPSQLYWTRGVGNSMEPAISDGDVILIDRSKVGSTFGDLYWAIAYGQTGMIKRLRPMPDGSVKILSDNPAVPPEVAYDGELHIFGRVVAVIKRL